LRQGSERSRHGLPLRLIHFRTASARLRTPHAKIGFFWPFLVSAVAGTSREGVSIRQGEGAWHAASERAGSHTIWSSAAHGGEGVAGHLHLPL